jgi:branched-chain amino acid aminotransferase
MLTQKPAENRTEATPERQPRAGGMPETDAVCWFEEEFVPLSQAKVGIMTHSFLYGTAVFEGIRGYWNDEQGQLYLLKLREHFDRMRDSGKVMMMDLGMNTDEAMALATDLVRRNGYHEDVYVRPTLYKSTQAIGVRLHKIDCRLNMFAIPFGDYIATDRGISAGTVSWRRNDDLAIPARSKIVGGYANAAFAKTEAQLNGYDEAIVLTLDGKVSEGSAENLFIVRRGQLITPGVTNSILEGITRAALMQLARNELSIETVVRPIDRSELYVADELFLCGTGAQVSSVISVDHRPIGTGDTGPVTAELTRLYFDAVRGRNSAYTDWLTPVY